MIGVRIYVSGIVQGVGFRYFTRKLAKELGVKGYVKNLSDGRVLAVAEGESEQIEKFISELRKGPRGAVVRDIKVEEYQPNGEHDSFVIAF
ncbi:Acylphosphatase [Archaeoglobus sulfaticallidus PM70-1]|uniref:Acylphosphatase n=1 Tax=Archaeoglobus sulfaticallidus PM70-1 TaxID=387631 RepID=N0BL67_9EURY|nr:acylphosphatase [Archaeoglobus sulfaticallidus]AGK61286.1 Acylphosphatase [Archaeoglobus sulfaticallidus PM70-1]